VVGEAQLISHETQKAAENAKIATRMAVEAARGMERITGDVDQISSEVSETVRKAFNEDPAQKHLIRSKTDKLRQRADQLRAHTQEMREKIAESKEG